MSNKPFEIKAHGIEKNYSAPKGAPKVKVEVNVDIPEDQQLFEIQELATTGWEALETNLNKENTKAKYRHYAEALGLPPGSIRIRRIR